MAKPQVVIVGADKGGVGKTTVSRILLDFYEDRGVRTRAFDTETPVGVLKRFHPAVTEIVDLTHTDGQVAVFDNLHVAPVTLIDIRAGLLSPSLKLLGELGFLSMSREGKLDVKVLHVIGSTVASFNEIAATAALSATPSTSSSRTTSTTPAFSRASPSRRRARRGFGHRHSEAGRAGNGARRGVRPVVQRVPQGRQSIAPRPPQGRSLAGWRVRGVRHAQADRGLTILAARWRTAGCLEPASG
jgi:hypothetical protein